MATKKMEFNINDFKYRIIEANVSSAKNLDEIEGISKMRYYFLVDQDNFIQDYKVQFDLINYTEFTTASHDEFPRKPQLTFRESFLRMIGTPNKWANGKTKNGGYSSKQYKDITNSEKIDAINDWMWKQEMYCITIKNIEYVLCGCNPGGEPQRENGKYKVFYQDNYYTFNTFVKQLNVSKEIRNAFNGVDFSDIWERFKKGELKAISFASWINSDSKLKNYFNSYVNNLSQYKTINENFKKLMKPRKLVWQKLNKEVDKKRRELAKAFDKIFEVSDDSKSFSSLKDMALNSVFNITSGFANNIQHAHIKPVWKIKKEYLKTENIEKLDEISDPANCLPLSPSVHDIYDKYYFYWNEEGTIVTINKDMNESEIDDYRQISQKYVKQSSKYLKDYIELLKEEGMDITTLHS